MTAVIELVRPDHRSALHLLFAACSPETVQLRFRARLPALPAAYLESLLAGPPELHDAVVASDRDSGTVVGLGSLALPDQSQPDTGELGLLVVDGWQRRGIGRGMTEVLVARARVRGVSRLVAEVAHGRSALLAALARQVGPGARHSTREGVTGLYRLDQPSSPLLEVGHHDGSTHVGNAVQARTA
ncbi:GNAT family N-acetyltransferase [Streptacidiphilus fuscans]|uniref:GNAT family N-acetyltransferase n=1 Tax=Streptacidiphilus fuscans TaxID=2789292 RepID=A0A931BDA4_9ACTN|nr:GNAT family N-acetyltransferase [Streptacidiphilus fuscans]MBF9072113.1 GNAT family N-acetyltransferase [Streptacidiphilus fuscans]